MEIVLDTLSLFAPLWLPNSFLYVYLLWRDYLPLRLFLKADKMYDMLYITLLLLSYGLFVWQIFGWQIATLYQWLLLLGLGVPMLGLILFIWWTINTTHHWVWFIFAGIPMLCFMALSFCIRYLV